MNINNANGMNLMAQGGLLNIFTERRYADKSITKLHIVRRIVSAGGVAVLRWTWLPTRVLHDSDMAPDYSGGLGIAIYFQCRIYPAHMVAKGLIVTL